MTSYLTSATPAAFFEGLSSEDRKALVMHTHMTDYARRQHLFWAGEEARALYIIRAGRIKLYCAEADGCQNVIRVAQGGDILGLLPAFENPQVHAISAETLTTTKVLEISMTAVRERISCSAPFREKLTAALAAKVRIGLEAKKVMGMPAPVRVAWLLLRLTEGMQGAGVCFRLPYGKSVAAAELGMSQETFSRALSFLEPLGVTRSDAAIDIESFDRLRAYVREGGCPKADLPEPRALAGAADQVQHQLDLPELEVIQPRVIADQRPKARRR